MHVVKRFGWLRVWLWYAPAKPANVCTGSSISSGDSSCSCPAVSACSHANHSVLLSSPLPLANSSPLAASLGGGSKLPTSQLRPP